MDLKFTRELNFSAFSDYEFWQTIIPPVIILAVLFVTLLICIIKIAVNKDEIFSFFIFTFTSLISRMRGTKQKQAEIIPIKRKYRDLRHEKLL